MCPAWLRGRALRALRARIPPARWWRTVRAALRDDGVGLAAPQVGVNVRLMVFNPYGREKPGNESILVNPEVVSVGKERWKEQEGCLSFPKIYSEVEVRGGGLVGWSVHNGQPCCSFPAVPRQAAGAVRRQPGSKHRARALPPSTAAHRAALPAQRPRDVVVRAQNEKGEPVTLSLGGADQNAAWVARIFQHEYDHLQVGGRVCGARSGAVQLCGTRWRRVVALVRVLGGLAAGRARHMCPASGKPSAGCARVVRRVCRASCSTTACAARRWRACAKS